MNNFWAPIQSRDNPANLFMFMCFSFLKDAMRYYRFLRDGNSLINLVWRRLLREWLRYCRKEYWTKMVQNGPNDHLGQNDLIPN